MSDTLPHIIWIILALVLVGSSLALRRLPTGNVVKMALLWVAIFGIIFLLVRLFAMGGA